MPATVCIIDDDPAVLDAVGLLLRTKGHKVACHSGAAAFLQAPFVPGCIISDVRMPEMTGLQLLGELIKAKDPRPIILLTGHGDIEMAMRAVKLGAFDFIEKPFKDARLLEAVRQALTAGEKKVAEQAELGALRERYDSLTQRQKETMQLLVEGHANKDIAARLGISPRTVEIYRAWVMTKMSARSLAELVHMGIRLARN